MPALTTRPDEAPGPVVVDLWAGISARLRKATAGSGVSLSAVPAWVANACALLWVAWLLAGLGGRLLADSGAVALPTQVAPSSVAPRRAGAEARQLADWHLFGVAGGGVMVARVAAPQESPDTSLDLVLRGVFASDDPVAAHAIVADPGGRDRWFRPGDPLPGNATLKAVYSDRILLERQGRLETLRFPSDLMTAGTGAVSRLAPSGNGVTGPTDSAEPSVFFEYAATTPARRTGWFIGFRLAPGPAAGGLEALGLEPGDIVTGIDGQTIESPVTGMHALRALNWGDVAELALLRDDQPLTLSMVLPSRDN